MVDGRFYRKTRLWLLLLAVPVNPAGAARRAAPARATKK